ncbi:hypothetical protein, partial [Herbaspirillum huttiense]|uniref:hypothetical protein n=1 Tax=Herbaspirillum huttiense TaxID=863372 RepID=UPI003B3A8EE6
MSYLFDIKCQLSSNFFEYSIDKTMAPESQEQTSIHGLRGLISKTAHKTAVLSSLVAALFGVPATLAHASEMS